MNFAAAYIALIVFVKFIKHILHTPLATSYLLPELYALSAGAGI